jgi:hypothetical protein
MDAFKAVFGFMWQQPLHVTLRQMRIVQIALVISSQALLWRIVDNLKALDATQAAMAYGAIAAALIVQIWQSINGMHKGNVKDAD